MPELSPSSPHWRFIRERAWAAGARAPGWPEGVRALSNEGQMLFGLDVERRLHWDGKPVKVRHRLDLTARQKLLAGLTAAAVILTGTNGPVQAIGTVHEAGCVRGWWRLACTPR